MVKSFASKKQVFLLKINKKKKLSKKKLSKKKMSKKKNDQIKTKKKQDKIYLHYIHDK